MVEVKVRGGDKFWIPWVWQISEGVDFLLSYYYYVLFDKETSKYEKYSEIPGRGLDDMALHCCH